MPFMLLAPVETVSGGNLPWEAGGSTGGSTWEAERQLKALNSLLLLALSLEIQHDVNYVLFKF